MKATEAKAYILKPKKRIDVIQEELNSISDYKNEYEKLKAKRDELKLKRIAYREELLNISHDYKISLFSPAYHEKVVEIGRKYRIEKLNNDIDKTIKEICHISPAANYF